MSNEIEKAAVEGEVMENLDGKLLLHPTKGMNARKTCCARCGAPMPEILLLGIHDSWDECDSCGKDYIGDRRAANTCCGTGTSISKGAHPESQPIPHGICEVCVAELQQHDEIVRGGGVYFQCEDCGKAGVIKRNDWTLEFKKSNDMAEDEAAGVTFTKETCPASCEAKAGAE